MNWWGILNSNLWGSGSAVVFNKEVMDFAFKARSERVWIQRGNIWKIAYDDEKLLLFAVSKGYEKTVELLLRKGVDPNILYYQGLKVLDIASYNGNEKIVNLLLQAGASIENENGYEALRCAVHKEHMQVVELLLQKGVVPNFWVLGWAHGKYWQLLFDVMLGVALIKKEDKNNFLIVATHRNNEQAVQLLLQIGVNANAKNLYGKTALQISATRDFSTIAELLLANGAGPERYDKPEQQPRLLYAFSQHREASYPYE